MRQEQDKFKKELISARQPNKNQSKANPMRLVSEQGHDEEDKVEVAPIRLQSPSPRQVDADDKECGALN